MRSNARSLRAKSSAIRERWLTRSKEGLLFSSSAIRTSPARHRLSRLRLIASASLLLVFVNPVLAPAQQTTTHSYTLQYEFKPKTPYSTDGLSFAFPTVGLFIGVSDYGDAAKVTSTPAHVLGASVMYEAFVDAAIKSENKSLQIPTENYFKGGEDAICALVFSPDGNHFASGSKDGAVRIWSGTTLGAIEGQSSHKSDACAEAFSPDSSLLVTGGSEGDVVIQSVRQDKAPITVKQPAGVCSVAFSPSGSEVLSTSLDGTTRIWKAAEVEEPVILPSERDCPAEKQEVHSCADGPLAAFGSNERTVVTSSCGAVRLWNLDKPEESTLLGKEKTTVHSVSFSPDGSQVWSVADDGVTFWPVEDESGNRQGHRNPAGRGASFSPDGKRIAVGQDSGFVSLFAVPSMQSVASLGAYGRGVKSLQFSQDGQYILVNSGTGNAWLQDASGSKPPAAVPRPDEKGDPPFTIRFAIDEGIIPSGRKTAKTEVVALSPDANYIVAGYDDGSVGIHPGIGLLGQGAFSLDNQVLLADQKFDKTATSIMEIWYLEHLRGTLDQLHYESTSGDEDHDDPSFLRMGRGAPVTRERIFEALSTAIQKADQTAQEQETTMLVVYVAAHGWIGPDGRQYLLPSDADASNPSTWIAYEDVLKPVRDFLTSPSSTGDRYADLHRGAIVIFDTCQIRLGSAQKTPVVSADDPENLTVIESTSPGQYAWHWTGNLKSTEFTTTSKSTSRLGRTRNSKPTDAKTESDYTARMSMFPYASQWALNSLIKDKAPNSAVYERRITMSEWMANTQEAIRLLQNDIPEVKETGYAQTVRVHNSTPPDTWIIVEHAPQWIFEVDRNAHPE